MKRIVSFFLLFSAVFALSSCGKTRHEWISDEMYDLGVAAVEIADEYLDGAVSLSDAYDRLDSNYSKQSYFYDHKHLDSFTQDYQVMVSTLYLLNDFRDKMSGSGTNETIRSGRERLAGKIWK